MPQQVIVVGGGLSGLSAAHQLLIHGANVHVFDKQGFFGGNSTKATSGINGALTRTQIDLEIRDSVQQFYDDTLKSAKDRARPDLIRVLTYNSAAAVEWLQDIFKLDLTLVSRLGGHSQPRTHRGHDAKFPGMAITYALMEKIEEIAEQTPDRAKIFMKCRVTSILKEGNTVIGVEYEDANGEKKRDYGPVVLATGGYAADFTETSFIKKYRPEIFDLPSTNGTHATGDGQKMVLAIGGNGVDLEKIQVHPTGLVDPRDPENKWKFLAAEALRGEGGLLLNGNGERFCDELGRRDYVSGEMFKNKFPIRLVLNGKASNVLDFHTKHYAGRGLMKKMTGEELAKDIGIPASKLQKVFEEYNEIADGKKKDPFGKKFFANGPVTIDDDNFYVALVTPVLHFTMGGVEINDKAEVLNHDKEPFEGLFACGELAGGVHGANRLGGSSLLGCVVYGRVAADSASKYLFQKVLKEGSGASGAANRLGQISLHIDPSQPGRVVVDWGNKGGNDDDNNGGNAPPAAGGQGASIATSSTSSSSSSAAPAAAKPKAFSIPEKEYSMEDVAKHNKKDDCWVVVKGVVMDVTKFLPDHPGGENAIVNFAGRDATEEFEMLHEDRVIPKYAGYAVIGRLAGSEPSLEL
ncbi:hypothetical protein CANCADRAFT_23179 [Tortispora caseinolytica NRRL Y-17796]|uniref:fumarate reductase (NADH) n=1 Tax=Tortispora caseinolytica NRRL Y-17796 TaxID=767744 RepID=A0A1E4TLX7_9ASCO|nr:hypothetical protein CANCADRAFT_23179 [Tortispora caseinolytica NRRL Y-17796]